MIAFLKTRANIKYKILNIIYIVILLATHAQGQNKYDYTIVSDTTINTVTRSISEEKIKKYRSNPAYNYEQNPDYEETGLRKLWMRFLRWLEDVLGDGGYSILGDIVYYGLILVAVVTLIMIILRAQLRLLDDAKHIIWRSGKTNHDYHQEIQNGEIKEQYDNLSYIYEYIWYGQFDVENQSEYDQHKNSFSRLFNQLNRR